MLLKPSIYLSLLSISNVNGLAFIHNPHPSAALITANTVSTDTVDPSAARPTDGSDAATSNHNIITSFPPWCTIPCGTQTLKPGPYPEITGECDELKCEEDDEDSDSEDDSDSSDNDEAEEEEEKEEDEGKQECWSARRRKVILKMKLRRAAAPNPVAMPASTGTGTVDHSKHNMTEHRGKNSTDESEKKGNENGAGRSVASWRVMIVVGVIVIGFL